MVNYRVFVKMMFNEESHLEATIGTHFIDGTPERQVDVALSSGDGYEVYTMALEGTLPDILAWMIEQWQDDDLAVQEFAEAAMEGRVEAM
jgi:hypothetical protein